MTNICLRPKASVPNFLESTTNIPDFLFTQPSPPPGTSSWSSLPVGTSPSFLRAQLKCHLAPEVPWLKLNRGCNKHLFNIYCRLVRSYYLYFIDKKQTQRLREMKPSVHVYTANEPRRRESKAGLPRTPSSVSSKHSHLLQRATPLCVHGPSCLYVEFVRFCMSKVCAWRLASSVMAGHGLPTTCTRHGLCDHEATIAVTIPAEEKPTLGGRKCCVQ